MFVVFLFPKNNLYKGYNGKVVIVKVTRRIILLFNQDISEGQ